MPGVATSGMYTHTLRLEQQEKGTLGALRCTASSASDASCIWVFPVRSLEKIGSVLALSGWVGRHQPRTCLTGLEEVKVREE